MVWRPGRGTRRIVVGAIRRKSGELIFEYSKEGVKEAQESGFVCYPDFPDLDKTYDTNILRTLSLRLNDPERTDIEDYYSFWEIPSTSRRDPYRVLSHTGGVLPTDNFEFLAEFYGAKGLALVTDMSGLTHRKLDGDSISEGDLLTWKREPDNPQDDKAVAVYKGTEKIGYIKKIHSHVFYKKGSDLLQVRVKRIEHNGHINKVFLSINYMK